MPGRDDAAQPSATPQTTKHQVNCFVCGEPLVYLEQSRELTCCLCGATETSNATCQAGHFVCNACHRREGVDRMIELCLHETSTDPIGILTKAMHDDAVLQNGPEHHTLVGASLVTAYANAGGRAPNGEPLNKQAALNEMKARSMQVPGGTCGFWGTCGAAASVGQALSILNGSSPLAQEPWAQCQRLTSMVLGRLADIGGPRCCKRTGYVALLVATPYVNRVLGSSMTLPDQVVCSFFRRNQQCKRADCPFFPGAGDAAKAIYSELIGG